MCKWSFYSQTTQLCFADWHHSALRISCIVTLNSKLANGLSAKKKREKRIQNLPAGHAIVLRRVASFSASWQFSVTPPPPPSSPDAGLAGKKHLPTLAHSWTLLRNRGDTCVYVYTYIHIIYTYIYIYVDVHIQLLKCKCICWSRSALPSLPPHTIKFIPIRKFNSKHPHLTVIFGVRWEKDKFPS